MATPNAKSLAEIPAPAKEHAKGLTWEEIDADRNSAFRSVLALTGFEADDQRKFQGILAISANTYARKRMENTFWKFCEGKQVLTNVARATGFKDPSALVLATFAAWRREGAQVPDELTAFRAYLSGL